MKNIKFDKKRLSAFAISLVMGASSLVGLSGCEKEKTYESKIDYTATEVTEVFKDDTKLDEAIESGVACYGDIPITEAIDELETALYIVDKVENDSKDIVGIVSELEKLSDEDYEKAEKLTKEEFDIEFEQTHGIMVDQPKTNNVFKVQEIRMHSMKMVVHKYKASKKFVQENADIIIEEYLKDSAKAVIANEINVDGEDINKIKIMHSSMDKEGKDIAVKVGKDKYIISPKTDGIGEGIEKGLYDFQTSDKEELTNNDRLKYIELGKKITMLGAKTKGKVLSKDVEILNDINLKEANNKMERTLKK